MPRPQPPPFSTARPTRKPPRLIPAPLRQAVLARCQFRCELCGEPLPRQGWQAHHRKLRSRGGLDTVENLLALHPLCHTRVHGHVDWATEQGFMLPGHEEPSRVAVAVAGGPWQRLTSAGSYSPARSRG